MTQIVIPNTNWTSRLAEAISNSQSGDEILVNSKDKAELGRRALARMAPNKNLVFVVQENRDVLFG